MDELAPLPRICISSAAGSGGKTRLALGLGRCLSKTAIVKPYKKGPDYIDAAWLARACGRPATNLDLFFMQPEDLRRLFVASAQGADFALIEGNRGLYDGMDDLGSYSTASLARELEAPILLCVNCAKTTRTMAAILQGLVNFEPDLTFCGVILNMVASSRHEAALRRAIERHTPLKVLGAIPRDSRPLLNERHMGLASFGASLGESAEKILNQLAEQTRAHCEVDEIVASAGRAPALPKPPVSKPITITTHRPRIGYVLDDILWFYYAENLLALEEAGAELVPLSLLDPSPKNMDDWQRISGLYLGGGFPEDYPAQISGSPILKTIRSHVESGMPIYAECGGFVLLCANLEKDGEIWPMGGVFPHTVKWRPKPQGLGYVQGQVVRDNPFFPRGMILRGHEFHYSGCSGKNTALALTRGRGMGGGDALLKNNTWAGYTHIFAPALPCWARNFVGAARAYT